jgi:hypothetical protein
MTKYPSQTSHLAELTESASRSLALRVSRRSFLSRLGRGVAMTAVGVTGTSLAGNVTQAYGITCSGCSIACAYLKGWKKNKCPTGSCNCGSWVVNVATSTCPGGLRRWTDCCNTGWCGNHGGANCDSTGADGNRHPSCYNGKEWCNCHNDSCGCSNCCGDPSRAPRVVCRHHACLTSLASNDCYAPGNCQ